MSTRVFSAVLAVWLLAGALPLRAQSLADVARKEEERRQKVKEPSKVYTNKDLASVPSSSAPASEPAASGTSTSEPAKDDKSKADDKSKPADQKEPAKDQAYWSGRLKQLQTSLDRDQTFAEALQSRINALTTDFVNRADPAQRSVIERDRQKAIAELDRLKKQIVEDKKAIDDLQEEARRAGVPPGWLRS